MPDGGSSSPVVQLRPLVRHHPILVTFREDAGYQARCGCGWTGEWGFYVDAVADADEHEREFGAE